MLARNEKISFIILYQGRQNKTEKDLKNPKEGKKKKKKIILQKSHYIHCLLDPR